MNQFVGNVDKLFNGMEMKVPAQVAEMAEANLEQARLIYAKAAENIKSYGAQQAAGVGARPQQLHAGER